MAINFREIARKELTLSPLMAGRTQIKTEDLIGQVVTVTEFDFATLDGSDGEKKTYPVMLLKEYPDRYYNGGMLLMKLCMAWAAVADDVESASEELKNSGGVQLKFRSTRTKAGNNLTSVDVL